MASPFLQNLARTSASGIDKEAGKLGSLALSLPSIDKLSDLQELELAEVTHATLAASRTSQIGLIGLCHQHFDCMDVLHAFSQSPSRTAVQSFRFRLQGFRVCMIWAVGFADAL